MSLETEVKIYLPDLDKIKARLKASGAEQSKPRLFERNIRYENATEDFSPRGIVLRLRQDDRVRLTYKEPPPAQESLTTITRIELETEVSDFAAMDAILKRLGFHEFVVYEKFRTTYTLANTEVVLDEMPYGNFIEVEGAPAAIEAAITQLGLNDHQRILASYVDLFNVVKNALGLDFRDLSFANFEGIIVPDDLLTQPT